MTRVDPHQLAREIRETLGPHVEPAPAAPLQVAVVATPPPRAWRLTPTRDPDTGLIVFADLELRE